MVIHNEPCTQLAGKVKADDALTCASAETVDAGAVAMMTLSLSADTDPCAHKNCMASEAAEYQLANLLGKQASQVITCPAKYAKCYSKTCSVLEWWQDKQRFESYRVVCCVLTLLVPS